MNDENEEYDDEYPTCDRTYAELRVYSTTLNLQEISKEIGLVPTSSRPMSPPARSATSGSLVSAKPHRWFLSSEGVVHSKDLRRHLDWLMVKLSGANAGIVRLRQQNVSMHLTCLWWSKHGDGGPILSGKQLIAINELGLTCQFEFGYFPDEVETENFPLTDSRMVN